jgi:hypothetical protein
MKTENVKQRVITIVSINFTKMNLNLPGIHHGPPPPARHTGGSPLSKTSK